jgi:ketosteroid isomerase-like protein
VVHWWSDPRTTHREDAEMIRRTPWSLLSVAALALAALTGCDTSTEDVEEGADQVQQEVEEGADQVQQEVEEGAGQVEEGAGQVQQEVEEGVDDAQDDEG